MNTIAAAAVELQNKANQAVVEQKAQRLIRGIVSEQDTIKLHESNITDLQKDLQALSRDQFTVESVIGGTVSGTGLNAETIKKVVLEMNKNQQDEVEGNGKNIVEAITSEQASIAAHNKTIEDLRKELSALSVADLVASDVLGQ